MPGDSRDAPTEEAGEELSSLKKVALITWDVKTENAMLRSRLEEQSQLICFLKRRADDTLQRCQALETINVDLERKSAELGERGEAERKKGDQLEERFELLAANHQQMIRFKDEYKRQNEELRAECDMLRESTHPELLEREQRIRELQAQLHAMETDQEEQGSRHEQEMGSLWGRVGQLVEENKSQCQELESLKHKLQHSQDLCCKAQQEISQLMEVQKIKQDEAERSMLELKREKEELLHLCMETGRTIQEKQREAAKLSDRLKEAETALQKAEEKYREDSAAVDADARVTDLHRRLEESEKESEQMRREFEAYKNHSGNLLSQERELNAKLRHLIG
ncbi:coiled-coil domain-containing protein 89 [Pelodytes ibericus]